jgi:hypothetical protein
VFGSVFGSVLGPRAPVMGIRIVNGEIIRDGDDTKTPSNRKSHSWPVEASGASTSTGRTHSAQGFSSPISLAGGPPDPTTQLPDVMIFGHRFRSVFLAGIVAVGGFMGWRAAAAASALLVMYTLSKESEAGPSQGTDAQRSRNPVTQTYNGGNSGTLHESTPTQRRAEGRGERAAQTDSQRFPGTPHKLSE